MKRERKYRYVYTIIFAGGSPPRSLVTPEMHFKETSDSLAEAHRELAKIGKPIQWWDRNRTNGDVGDSKFCVRRSRVNISPKDIQIEEMRERLRNMRDIEIGTRCLIDGEVYKVVSLQGPLVERVDSFVTPPQQYRQELHLLQQTKIRTLKDIRKALVGLCDEPMAIIKREDMIVVRVASARLQALRQAEKMASRISDLFGVQARPLVNEKTVGQKYKTSKTWAEAYFDASFLNSEDQ